MKDVKKAINSRLQAKFPSIEINSNDVKEGFARPSFFVELVGRRTSLTEHVDRDINITVYYFPTDDYENAIELLDTQEQLESTFDLKFKVADRWINIEDTSIVTTDGVLNMSFSLEFNDARDITEDSNWLDKEYTKPTGPPPEHFEKYPVELMEDLNFILDKE
ncbi:phage tail terminator family protein [Kurthia zopfii]